MKQKKIIIKLYCNTAVYVLIKLNLAYHFIIFCHSYTGRDLEKNNIWLTSWMTLSFYEHANALNFYEASLNFFLSIDFFMIV